MITNTFRIPSTNFGLPYSCQTTRENDNHDWVSMSTSTQPYPTGKMNILALGNAGHSVFVTGRAGVGKTFLLMRQLLSTWILQCFDKIEIGAFRTFYLPVLMTSGYRSAISNVTTSCRSSTQGAEIFVYLVSISQSNSNGHCERCVLCLVGSIFDANQQNKTKVSESFLLSWCNNFCKAKNLVSLCWCAMHSTYNLVPRAWFRRACAVRS